MRCPLCKEDVEDKETLQVHYITSCTGYRQPAAAGSARDLPIAAARKATVTFLWKKSTPTIEREIFLFSTFDQVQLQWNDHDHSGVFKSAPTSVKLGTYSDCQLFVNGELYPTRPVVIERDNQIIYIQLQGGNIEEVEQDWRENLAFVDRNGTESSVDPPREQARLDAARSGHTSRATTGLERQFHGDQHYHRDDGQRQDWLLPSDGRRSGFERSNEGGRRHSEAQPGGDLSSRPPNAVMSQHDLHVDEVKATTSIFPANPPSGHRNRVQPHGSVMAGELTSEQRHFGDHDRRQQHAGSDLPDYPQSRDQGGFRDSKEKEYLYSRQVQELISERDKYQGEAKRSGEFLKNLTAELEKRQNYEEQLLQKQKELNCSVSHLRQLLNEKAGAEQELMKQNQGLQHDCHLAYQDNRNWEQKVAKMERQWQQNVADRKKAEDALQKVLEQQEQIQRYNRHLKEELASCQEKVGKEQEATSEINKVAVQYQDRVRQLEADLTLIQQHHKDTSEREQHMKQKIESLQNKLEDVQVVNETLSEELQIVQTERATIGRENVEFEEQLNRHATTESELQNKCVKLEVKVTKYDKEFDALQQHMSSLETRVAVATSLKEEHEGRVESLEIENTSLADEVCKLKTKLKQQQEDLRKQISDTETQVRKLSQENEAMRARCAMYESDFTKAEEAKKEVVETLSKEETKAKNLEGQLQHKQDSLQRLEGQINEQKAKNESLQRQLRDSESDMTRRNKKYELLKVQKVSLENKVAAESTQREEHERRAKSFEIEKSRLFHEVQELKIKLSEQQSKESEKIVKLECKLRTVQVELKQLEAQKIQDDELTDTITTLRQENETLRAKCDEFEKAVSKVKNLTDQLKHKQEKLAFQARKVEDAEKLAISCKTEANKTISDLTSEKQTLEDCIKTGQNEQLSLQTQLEEAKRQKEVALREMEGRLQGSVKEIEGLKQEIADLKGERLALKKAESWVATMSEEKRRLEKETKQLHRRLEEEQRKTAEKETLAQQLESRLTFAEEKVLVSDEELGKKETELRKCREKLTTLERESHSKRKLQTSKAALETKLQESESKGQAQENDFETSKKLVLSTYAYEEIRERMRRYRIERNEARDELVKLGKLSKRPSSPMPSRRAAGLMDTNHKSQQKLEGSSARHVQVTRATDCEDRDMKNPTALLTHDAKLRSVAPVTSSGNANHVDGCSSRKHLNATTSLPVNQPGVLSVSTLTPVSQLSHCNNKHDITINSTVFLVNQFGQPEFGKVAYLGKTCGDVFPQEYVGVVFDSPVGNIGGSDGSCPYFKCAPNHGKLVPAELVTSTEQTDV